MAPATPAADDSHQQLLDQLDLTLKSRPFRNPHWKPSQRRNKSIKQILSEASRKEASVLATQNNSGWSTPIPQGSTIGTGVATPVPANGSTVHSNIAQAARNLSTMVLEKNLQASMSSGPIATYTNIESAPSLHPAHQKHYCDITGLPAPYTDPKTRLRYHNKEVFDVIRTLSQGTVENYLEARGAHVVLK
ncbi:chromatin-remodeling complex subunit ies6 [Lobaria immixta]|nr:chromatin-remodeling complex subunit ies6 [Lobaria immixta]